ncbi:hypothetical protein CYY_002077 [Polysphondylium violaceum]|uniref:SAM domain-containing protein n=1 Tax=Polysphondylium violaceum TaxID=133409 RepID=A0A8J4UVH6_9MYCE|nr:hypothetical protein CYY_002077 [Polysphondylium violaceum]
MTLQTISSMTNEQLCSYLTISLGEEYIKYIEKFKLNQIDGSDFIDLTHNDYEVLSIPWKYQKKFKQMQESGKIEALPPLPQPLTPDQGPTPAQYKSEIEKLNTQVSDLTDMVSDLSKQIELLALTKNPKTNLENIPQSLKDLLLNPSPDSKTIPIVLPSDDNLTPIPTITNEIPSLIDATHLPNLPRASNAPVPLCSVAYGPSDNVSFCQFYDQSKNNIAILPNFPDPFDNTIYGDYLVTISDEAGIKEIVSTKINLRPQDSIVVPHQFSVRTPLGDKVNGSIEVYLHGVKVHTWSISDGIVNLPTNLQDGKYKIIIKSNSNLLLPLSLNMIIHGASRTSSSIQWLLRSNITTEEYEFVLSWNTSPRDLDSHMWCRHPNGVFEHVYYRNKAVGNMNLDCDVTSGIGPETVRFKPLPGCKYIFAVHKYSEDGELAQSGANVKIGHNRLTLSTKSIPNTQQNGARFWVVCSIDGTTGSITEINKFEFHNNFENNDVPTKYL